MNASLERLGLEYVDLIYAHRPDRYTPMDRGPNDEWVNKLTTYRIVFIRELIYRDIAYSGYITSLGMVL